MSDQLIKDCCKEGYRKVYPTTFIEAVKDKLTGKGLDEILASFNMLYVSYAGSREDTRLQIPKFLRRKGLWITYTDYDNKIRTEWYNCCCIDDCHWESDIHWNVALNMTDLLEDYFTSDAFYSIFVDALTNTIKNIIGDLDLGIGVDEETVRKIVAEIIDGLDLSNQIQNAVNNYVNSEEFINRLNEYFESVDLTEIVNNAVNNYINNDESIKNLVSEAVNNYFKDIDLTEIIENIDWSSSLETAVNNWFTENGDVVIELVTPVIEEKVNELREELKQWCNDVERVIANALIRHEQWIQEHSVEE